MTSNKSVPKIAKLELLSKRSHSRFSRFIELAMHFDSIGQGALMSASADGYRLFFPKRLNFISVRKSLFRRSVFTQLGEAYLLEAMCDDLR